MAERLIISMHLPKTAGTAFGSFLLKHFGEDRTMLQYEQYPFYLHTLKRGKAIILGCCNAITGPVNHIGCIHGHFYPVQYVPWIETQHLFERQQKICFVTWFRHPVQQMVSHYYYTKRNFSEKSVRLRLPRRHPGRRVVDEDWSLERFCLGKEYRNIYSIFLWKIRIEWFDFIGLSEHFDADLNLFSRYILGKEPPECTYGENKNAHPDMPPLADRGEGYPLEPGLQKRIEAWHAKDMALYAQAQARRNAILHSWGH